MSDYTPYWVGIIRGFRTSGGDPWQVCIEMPESKDGSRGPSVNFSRGQSVHVFTDEGLNRVKAEVWDEAIEALAWAKNHGTNPLEYVHKNNPYRKGETG